jgi:hypothetical protein
MSTASLVKAPQRLAEALLDILNSDREPIYNGRVNLRPLWVIKAHLTHELSVFAPP